VNKIIETILSCIYPKRCVHCNTIGAYFCNRCTQKILYIKKPICPVCTKPALDGETHPRCRTRYSIDGLVSIFRYTGPIRDAIKLIKYRRIRSIGLELVNLAGYPDILRKHLMVQDSTAVLVPIPLYWLKKRERMFNQSEILAREIGILTGISIRTNILLRIRQTSPQAGKKKKERLHNIKGAFRLAQPVAMRDIHTVILVDDVWTTGATMREAAGVLKRGGVKRVWGLTIAR
jgi:competence protein ComFC